MTLSRRPRFQTVRRVALALALLWLCLPATFTASRGAESGAVLTGLWRPTVYPPGDPTDYIGSVQLYPDLASRRLFAMGANDGWVVAYDLDTMQPLGAGVAAVPSGFRSVGIPDPQLGGMFIASYGGARYTDVAIDAVVVDGGNMKRVGRQDLSLAIPGDVIVGLYRAPGTNALWAISENQQLTQPGTAKSGPGLGIRITEIDTSKFGTPGAVVWTTPHFPDCTRTVHDNAGLRTPAAFGYVPEHNALYFACANASVQDLTSPPTARGVSRLMLNGNPSNGPTPTPAAKLEVFPKDGNFAGSYSVFDPASRRLAMIAQGGAGIGLTSIYVFDAISNSYVGSIAAGRFSVSSIGLDPVAGRLYSNGFGVGLIVADIRPSPTTQGQNFPEYGFYQEKRPDDSIVAVDPQTSRVFLRFSNLADFVIVEDRIPKYITPPPPDLDVHTVDVAEAPGQTVGTYAAAAQGYGVRARQIGGQYALQVNFTSETNKTVGIPGIGTVPLFPLGAGTREFDGAYLNHLAVTNEEAGASVVPADRDEANTGADMGKHPTWPPVPAPIDWPEQPKFPEGSPNPFEPLVPWPYRDAKCLDLGNGSTSDRQGSGFPQDRSAAASACDLGARTATAQAALDPITVNSDMFVGATSMSSKAVIDPVEGAVTTVTATAKNINVLGVLQIGEVTATAVTRAKGRPQTTSASYDRFVKDVIMTVDGQTRRLCDSESCSLESLAKQINENSSGRLTVRFPEPLQMATPRGYAALIQRHPMDIVQEVLVNEQSPDRLDMPAMTIVVSQDGYRPARTVLDFAAVAADSRYGISLIDKEEDGGTGEFEAAARDGLLGDGGLGPTFGGGDGVPPGVTRGVGSGDGGGGGGGLFGLFGGNPIRFIWDGFGRLRGMLPIWAILVAPAYVAARRWLLLQRAQLISRGGS